MRTRLLLVLAFLCTCFTSFGQMIGDINEFVEFKKRPLIVVLPETKFEKDKAEEARVNQILQSRVKSFWTLNKDITFMKASEMEAFVNKKKKKELQTHAVLQFTVWKMPNTQPGNYGSWYTSTLSVGLLEDASRQRYTYIHNFVPIYPSEGDMVSAIVQIQNFMSKSISEKKEMSFPNESKKNVDKLRKVTLLVDQKQLESNLTEKEIKERYALPFKQVDAKEVEDAILNRKKGFAYVYILPAGIRDPNLMVQLVLSAETGEVLAHSFPPKFRIGSSSGAKIDAGNFKDFSHYTRK